MDAWWGSWCRVFRTSRVRATVWTLSVIPARASTFPAGTLAKNPQESFRLSPEFSNNLQQALVSPSNTSHPCLCSPVDGQHSFRGTRCIDGGQGNPAFRLRPHEAEPGWDSSSPDKGASFLGMGRGAVITQISPGNSLVDVFVLFLILVSVCACVCNSGNSFQELILCLYYVGPKH